MKNQIIIRSIYTVISYMIYSTLNALFYRATPIITGNLAVRQLEDSDAVAVQVPLLTDFLSHLHISSLVFILTLALIWLRPYGVKEKIKATLPSFSFVALAALTSLTVSPHANAYMDAVDKPEYVEILPNQTAFAIPEQGANKTNQTEFMSEAYLTENKVAMKRFQIPHMLIKDPRLLTRDYYVPATKLLIVDRAPYMREWRAGTRGTSRADESFEMESADSVNLSFGVTISAHVLESDAAKFVYNFGVKTTGAVKSNDEETTYASIIEGRSLSDVMDTNVRGKLQALLASEFGNKTTLDCLKRKSEIMNNAQSQLMVTFKEKGIIIDYVGYATPLNFTNPKIQDAIDNTFIAERQAQATVALQATLPVNAAMADIEVRKATADAIRKYDGKLPALPNFVVIPNGFFDTIQHWFEPAKK